MRNRFVHTQRIGYGVDIGIASIPQRRTIHLPITIRTMATLTGTTAGMSAGYILAAADITAAVDTSAVDFVEVAQDTPVVAIMATGRVELKRQNEGNELIEALDRQGSINLKTSILSPSATEAMNVPEPRYKQTGCVRFQAECPLQKLQLSMIGQLQFFTGLC
jgi:hypothetical protein